MQPNKNYKIRTDLALEMVKEQKPNGYTIKKRKTKDIIITEVLIDKNGEKLLQRKEGLYITIEFPNLTNENKEIIEQLFGKELKNILKKSNIKEDSTCFIIGLGNDKSTPDSLGPLCIDQVLVTNYIYELANLENGYRRVYALAPGVMGQTGIETSDIIKSIVKMIKPDFLLVIDSLASNSISRVNKTIQMTNTGINPGSGIGNNRKEISEKILKIPVIAIGVPTVVDAVTIVSETINHMYDFFATKLDKDLKTEKKRKLLGLIGELNEKDTRTLLEEILSPAGNNLMVTPKEVDFVIKELSEIIAKGINKVLHKKPI